jgi:hypothetical protein
MVLFDEDTTFNSALTFEKSDVLLGSAVKDNVVILDAICEGITVDQLKALTNLKLEVYNKNGELKAGDELVVTGDTIVAGGKTYGVAVVGDTDGDGKVGQKDADDFANCLVGIANGFAEELIAVAADVSGNGTVNGADLARLIQKYARAATYESNI